MKRLTGAKGTSLPWTFFIVLCLLLPGISAGASYTGSRPLLLGIFLLIGLSLFAVALRNSASDSSLMLLIFCFGLSLLFSSVFISNNLFGFDINEEYRLFLQVSRTGHWTPTFESLYSSVVSISILPSIIASVTGLDGITIFKIVFPLLYSLVPVILFKIYRTVLPPRDAFLSAFLFASYPVFYGEMLQLGRQMIAEVLLVILIWMMLSGQLKYASSVFTTVILTFGLVISHYSLAFVFVGIVLFSSLVSRISHRKIEAPIRAAMLVIVATVAWFAFVASGVALATLTQDMLTLINGMISDLFGGQRSAQVMLAVGAAPGLPGILHSLNRVIQWCVQLLLFLGCIVLVLEKRKSQAESRILPLVTFAMVFLGASVVLPLLASTLNLTRIYHIALIFVAPCFMIGIGSLERLGKSIGSMLQHSFHTNLHFHFSTKQVVAAAILCSYLLFVSGWTWAATMDRPTSEIFDSDRIVKSTDIYVNAPYFDEYIPLPDIAAARWISEYNQANRTICSDFIAQYEVLTSYGELPRGGPVLPWCESDSYTYLREFNVAHGYFVLTQNGALTPASTPLISDRLTSEDRVFSGVAVIYYPE